MTDLSSQDDVPTCRICHCSEGLNNGLVKLISPCQCSGSLKYVHHGCLQQWLDATNTQRCELCKHPFSMSVKYKPLYKWGSLNASPGERKRLICNSVFNLVSMVCIFWSIYVLIERAALDARSGQIDWSFYVKISVVTIGLIIGVIFLFVQLKLYFSIFMKWRQSNRIIVIRDANFSNQNNTSNSNDNSNNHLTTNNTSTANATTNTTSVNLTQQNNLSTQRENNHHSIDIKANTTNDHIKSGSKLEDNLQQTQLQHNLQGQTKQYEQNNGGSTVNNERESNNANKAEYFVVPMVGIMDGKLSETTEKNTHTKDGSQIDDGMA